MKVRATQAGHYGGYYRNEGDVFEISDAKHIVLSGDGLPEHDEKGKPTGRTETDFSAKWMEEVTQDVPSTPMKKPVPRNPLESLKIKEKPDEQPNTLADTSSLI